MIKIEKGKEQRKIENKKDLYDFIEFIAPVDEYGFNSSDYYHIFNSKNEMVDKFKFSSGDEVQLMLDYMSIKEIILDEKEEIENKINKYFKK